MVAISHVQNKSALISNIKTTLGVTDLPSKDVGDNLASAYELCYQANHSGNVLPKRVFHEGLIGNLASAVNQIYRADTSKHPREIAEKIITSFGVREDETSGINSHVLTELVMESMTKDYNIHVKSSDVDLSCIKLSDELPMLGTTPVRMGRFLRADDPAQNMKKEDFVPSPSRG